MDIDIIKEEIQQLAQAVNEQIDIIMEHDGKIPQIEIDIFMQNIRKLYEVSHELDKTNAVLVHAAATAVHVVETAADPVEPETVRHEEPVVMKVPEPEEIRTPVPEEMIRFETRVEPQVKEETAIDPPVLQTSIPEPEPELPLETIQRVERSIRSDDLFSASSSTISDRFRDEKKTIHEKLSHEQEDKSINARLHQSQISDLKTVIGINEKFQFINELFEGNMQDYTMVINQLNLFRNLDEALEFIDILKLRYHWDKASEAYKKLTDIVNRRYH